MEERKYKIYKHISPSGKVYIGMTGQKLYKRYQRGRGYIECPRFWEAIQKYGWENFTHEVIVDNLSEEKACELEKFYINEYKSNDINFGYNICDGGNKGTPGHILSEEALLKISENHADVSGANNPMYGKRHTEDSRRKMSETRKERYRNHEYPDRSGKNSPMYGRHLSEETKQKMRDSLQTKTVKCIETGKVYSSLSEVSKDGFHSSCVSAVINGHRKTHGGYHWIVIDE